MSLAFPHRENLLAKEDCKWSAVRPAPAPAGDSHWCHGFCQRDNKQINNISLQRITSAKTRANATLRQRHIPPNVTSNFGNSTKKYCFLIWKLLYLHKIANSD